MMGRVLCHTYFGETRSSKRRAFEGHVLFWACMSSCYSLLPILLSLCPFYVFPVTAFYVLSCCFIIILAPHAAHVSPHIFRNGYSDALFRSFTLATLVRAQPDMLKLQRLCRPLVTLLILPHHVLIFCSSLRRPT